jgi:hypothetical protein
MLLISLLRLMRIFAAVLWVGMGFTNAVIIYPAVKGEAGFAFLKNAFAMRITSIVFPITAVLTTLAGVLLYLTGSPSRFTTAGNIVLGIGAIAGLGAFGHGGAVLSPMTNKIAALVKESPKLKTEDAGNFDNLIAEYLRHMRISLISAMIALVGMGLARYLT